VAQADLPPEINYALRQTLVLCLPVAVGLISVIFSRAAVFPRPACCNIAGLDTPHKRFFNAYYWRRRCLPDAAIVQLLLAQTIPLPLILTGLALILGVTAEISPCTRGCCPPRLSRPFSPQPRGNMPVWEPLLIYALGTLWYGLFNWFWFWLWREQPLRESLSLLYRELADYCEAKYSMLTQHADPEKRCLPCWCASKKRWI
jgi:uncharacterized membrane protein YccC